MKKFSQLIMIFMLLFTLINNWTPVLAGDGKSQVSSLVIEDVRIGATKDQIKRTEKDSKLIEKELIWETYQRANGDIITYYFSNEVNYKYADQILVKKKAADLRALYDKKLKLFKKLFGEPTAEMPARTFWYPENIEFCLFYNGEQLMYEIREYKLSEFDRKQIAQCTASSGYKIELTKKYGYLDPIVSYQSYEELKSKKEAVLNLNMEEIKPNSFKSLPKGGWILVTIFGREFEDAKPNNFTFIIERNKKVLDRKIGRSSSPSTSGDRWVGVEIIKLKEPIKDYINFYVVDNIHLIRTKFVIRKINQKP